MPRSKEQFEAMRKATNEKILAAAVPLFSQKGFAATGVQEIADAAGISVGLLYRHYKTKDEIFGALVQMGIDGLKEAGGELEGEPVAVVKWWARDVLNDITKNDEFIQFMHILSPTTVADENFPMGKEIMQAHVFFSGQVADLIKRGQADETFRAGDPQGMAQFFLIIVGGIASMKLALKDNYICPTPAMLTAFLLKEEHNIYE